MPVKYSKEFLKNYKKRILPNKKLVEQFEQRLTLFLQSPKDFTLRDHKLKGAKRDLRAFSITGDIRVVYYYQSDFLVLVDIGSHNQVY